jgi:hypothetical protein
MTEVKYRATEDIPQGQWIVRTGLLYYTQGPGYIWGPDRAVYLVRMVRDGDASQPLGRTMADAKAGHVFGDGEIFRE